MKIAGAAAGDHVDHGPAGSAGVGRVQPSFDLEFRNGIDARKRHQSLVAAAIHIVGAVHRPVVGGIAAAIHGIGNGGGRPGRRRNADIKLIRGRGGNAGHQCRKLLVVAGSERKFPHLYAFNRGGAGGRYQIDSGLLLLHLDRLADRSHIEFDIEFQIVIDVKNDPRARRRLEALGLDLQAVMADRQQRRGVVPGRIRRHGPDDFLAIRVGHRYLCVWNRSAGRVQNRALNGCRDVLSQYDGGRQKCGGRHA